MPKRKEIVVSNAKPSGPTFAPTDAKLDPGLASLFASSAGPVKVPAKATKTSTPVKPELPLDDESSESSLSEEEGLDGDENTSSGLKAGSDPTRAGQSVERPRKRRRVTEGDNLEASYFKRLEREEENEQRQKLVEKGVAEDDASDADSASDSGADSSPGSQQSIDEIPQHETLDSKSNNEDKLRRTVFLGNVSTAAIKSKTAKRELSRHLRSVLKTPAQGKRPGKLESLRFRSTAYASGGGPKKATFAKKELMDKTTPSTNAYAVFTTETAAELVAEKLNGTVVLDRHLRADHLANPSKIDHKRCVFIGNLSFVSEEAPAESGEDGSNKHRPTGKEPADAEEGLWRTFSKVGEVESVRVVRDQETRVSKGFAYVQFRSANGVEAALVMNDKKFPPMLPRKLRVTRAKAMKIKPSAARSRAAGAANNNDNKIARPKPGLIFEGHRASSNARGTGKPGALKKRHKKRPDTRSSRRGAAFKAGKAKKKA